MQWKLCFLALTKKDDKAVTQTNIFYIQMTTAVCKPQKPSASDVDHRDKTNPTKNQNKQTQKKKQK